MNVFNVWCLASFLALPYTKMAPLGDWESAGCRRGILPLTSRAKERLE